MGTYLCQTLGGIISVSASLHSTAFTAYYSMLPSSVTTLRPA